LTALAKELRSLKLCLESFRDLTLSSAHHCSVAFLGTSARTKMPIAISSGLFVAQLVGE